MELSKSPEISRQPVSQNSKNNFFKSFDYPFLACETVVAGAVVIEYLQEDYGSCWTGLAALGCVGIAHGMARRFGNVSAIVAEFNEAQEELREEGALQKARINELKKTIDSIVFLTESIRKQNEIFTIQESKHRKIKNLINNEITKTESEIKIIIQKLEKEINISNEASNLINTNEILKTKIHEIERNTNRIIYETASLRNITQKFLSLYSPVKGPWIKQHSKKVPESMIRSGSIVPDHKERQKN